MAKPEVVVNAHLGHSFSYVEDGWQSYSGSVDDDGNIVVNFSSPNGGDVSNTSLFCDDCGVEVSGAQLGANDDWQAVGV